MKVASPPFTLSRTAIPSVAWVGGDPTQPGEPLSAQRPNWDAAVDLTVHCHLTVDQSVLADETGLGLGSRLRLVSGWHCDATRTRKIAHARPFELRPAGAQLLEVFPCFSLPGHALARSVRLESRLVLVEASDDSAPTAARMPGSVLWYAAQPLALEPTHARFPMEWADFRSSVYSDDAAWALDWDPQDLDCSTLGSVRLLLNQNNKSIAKLLRDEQSSDASKLMWATIRFDIARQLIEGALRNEEFVDDPMRYDDGSLGATIRRMISTHIPGYEVSTLRAMASRSRTQFETLIQSRLSAYGGT